MYAVDGARELPERELTHLPGYADSRPVRLGNAAVDQRQTDVLGEVMVALEAARQAGIRDSADSWALQRTLVEDLAQHWNQPDNGIWEIRGEPQHFTHSRVMVWAAFDRAVAAVERHGLDGPVERWRALREEVRAGGADPRLRQRPGHLHPALRHQGGRRLPAADSHRSGSCRRTTRACSGPSARWRRT